MLVPVHHLKPPCIEKLRDEVASLPDRRLGFVEQGRTYELRCSRLRGVP